MASRCRKPPSIRRSRPWWRSSSMAADPSGLRLAAFGCPSRQLHLTGEMGEPPCPTVTRAASLDLSPATKAAHDWAPRADTSSCPGKVRTSLSVACSFDVSPSSNVSLMFSPVDYSPHTTSLRVSRTTARFSPTPSILNRASPNPRHARGLDEVGIGGGCLVPKS
jgi:hypothetical protein